MQTPAVSSRIRFDYVAMLLDLRSNSNPIGAHSPPPSRLICTPDLTEQMPHIPAALRAIIASELVPPYATATTKQQQQQYASVDVDVSALLTERQPAPIGPVASSRYIQMPAKVRVDTDGAAVAASDDDGGAGGAFTYNCAAGMIFRETTV